MAFLSLIAATGSASMLHLKPVDLLIIVIYFIFVLAIGFYLKKYASTGDDFFMAGRKMTAWIAGLSFISANLSSLETMGWSAMAYQYGMLFGQGIAVAFGYWCTNFLQVQRVIVAKDLRSAQNGTIIGAALKMMVPLIVTIPGLLGLAVLMNSDGSPMVLVPESDPRAGITHNTFNDVLPLLMRKYLGPGLLGLGVIARSDKAKPMAVNMYSSWWSLVVCLLVTIVVSLFTRPKPEAELKNLVMGLTPLPKEEAAPWHRKPLFWAAVVMAVFVVINILFW